MKAKWRIVLILVILLGSLLILSSGTSIPAQAYEIRDLSWIKIPDYSSPDLFPIEKTIQEIMTRTQNEVADTPKNPSVFFSSGQITSATSIRAWYYLIGSLMT